MGADEKRERNEVLLSSNLCICMLRGSDDRGDSLRAGPYLRCVGAAASSGEKLTVERGSSLYITPPPPVRASCRSLFLLSLSLPLCPFSRVFFLSLSFFPRFPSRRELRRDSPPPPSSSVLQRSMHFHPRRAFRGQEETPTTPTPTSCIHLNQYARRTGPRGGASASAEGEGAA